MIYVGGIATGTLTPSPSGEYSGNNVSFVVNDALAQQLNEQRETENYKNFILLALMVLFVRENGKSDGRSFGRMEVKIRREDFEDWLYREHKSSFKSLEQIKDFAGQGMAFLFTSGSNLLKSYILRRVRLIESQEQLLRTVQGQTYLWWIFSQTVEEIHCSKDELTIVYKPKEEYKPLVKY